MSNFKIVQSFWSKPFLEAAKKNKNLWLNKEMFFISNALSVLKLKEFYSNVELVTDHYGKRILIDILKLPYDSVDLSLNDIDNYRHELWAVGKIKAYSIQNEPFLHIDNDVFLWKAFEESFLTNPLFCQNFENNVEYYSKITEEIKENAFKIPKEMTPYIENKANLNGYEGINAGIIGGNDLDFFKKYCQLAFNIIDKNYNKLDNLSSINPFNVFFEQALFHSLSIHDNVHVEKLFPPTDKSFIELVRIENIPSSFYIHPVAVWKKSIHINEYIYITLKESYPEYFERIQTLLKEKYHEVF
ncbi:hypothetical protein SAMN05880574_12631 [Chryseobacterium sp. RU37D]|uniref:DUF6734 family protein n=1 Tax=Chryseobacterium sp. RU37D TaxID=1907397 RepID=UPI00095644B4|nr:DUF6734 family protein [Chryseobacterium sp. RU37D]SIQ80825.1 hypothetical protein SAMN05880574_12631 [Chryseobacterium sp. RU37D]